MKDINIEIDQRIKKRRKFLKYTSVQLAELVDISPQFISDIESGKKHVFFNAEKAVRDTWYVM